MSAAALAKRLPAKALPKSWQPPPKTKLRYLHAVGEGLTRRRSGKKFSYFTHTGKAVRDIDTLERLRGLAIPPAWRDVWISPHADAHLQATGYDARGRKQYLYHSRWRELRDEAKFHHLVEFCRALPKIRLAVAADLASSGLSRRKVLATVVALMERAQLRVGNDAYTRENGSYGATTLRGSHATIHGDTVELAYRAKGGIGRRVRITDRRLTRIVRSCQELRGQRLFQYLAADGQAHRISSCDVNDYLHEVSGGPFTAKDYRTWAATMGAAMLLSALEVPSSQAAAKRAVKEVLCTVAAHLGHTPTICKKSYVHPRVIDDFGAGSLAELGRAVERALHGQVADGERALAVDSLRAVEGVVARYLDKPAKRRRAA